MKRANRYRLQAAGHSGGVDAAPKWLGKRFLPFNSFIVTASPSGRIAIRNSTAIEQTTDLVEKLRAQNVAFEEPIIPDEIHDLLGWNDWVRAYRATASFLDRRLSASGEQQ